MQNQIVVEQSCSTAVLSWQCYNVKNVHHFFNQYTIWLQMKKHTMHAICSNWSWICWSLRYLMWAVFSAHCSAKTMPVVLICTAAIFIVGHRVPRIAVGVALGQTDAHHAQNTDSADQEGRTNITRLWTFLRFFSKSSSCLLSCKGGPNGQSLERLHLSLR